MSAGQNYEQNKMSVSHKTLFLDWKDVERGFLDACLEPNLLSEFGKEHLSKLAELGRKFTQTGHAFRRRMLSHGVRITVEKAVKSEPWLLPDKPWEAQIHGGTGPTVIYEEGRYRCWYATVPPYEKALPRETELDRDRAKEASETYLCYTESQDGIHWTKPEFSIVPFKGHKVTNIVTLHSNGSAVFRDDSAPSAERYKLFSFSKLHDVGDDVPVMRRYGLYGVVSPDGCHWTKLEKPLIRYFCDTQNIGAWDPVASQYVGYFRSHVSGRSISRSATKDFRNWPEPETIMYSGAEDVPMAIDYQTNCYTWHPDNPSLKLMFPAITHWNDDHIDVRLATSLNGLCWNWVSRDPVIEVGKHGDWDEGQVYGHPNLVRLPNSKLALPYSGTNRTHEESWFDAFYKDRPEVTMGVAWAMWEDDRLAGVDATDFGEFWTRPVTFDAERIEINARTAHSGSVSVELWDYEGNGPIANFTLYQAVPFSGDKVWTPCKWNNATADLSVLKGRKIRLRFQMSCAKVFGYRFVTKI